MQQSPNQTSFSRQEPLFEKPRLTVEQEKKQADLAALPWFKKRKNIVLLVVGLVVLLISTIALMPKPTRQVTETSPTPSVAPITQTQTGMQARVQSLKDELEAAETSQQALPFPAVDMEITL